MHHWAVWGNRRVADLCAEKAAVGHCKKTKTLTLAALCKRGVAPVSPQGFNLSGYNSQCVIINLLIAMILQLRYVYNCLIL
jgi:hypothetical protein